MQGIGFSIWSFGSRVWGLEYVADIREFLNMRAPEDPPGIYRDY